MSKIGRNDPCHCGSGNKYKKCCLERDAELTHVPAHVSSMGGLEIQIPDSDELDGLDDRFHAADFSGKVLMLKAYFAAPPEDDGMLFEWFLDLNDAVETEQERAVFGECLDLLSVSLPEVYSECIGHLLNERLKIAVKDGDVDVVSRLFRELACSVPLDFDRFFQRADQLAYLGHLDALLRGIRAGWPSVRDDADISDSGIEEYAGLGADFEIFTYLQTTPHPVPENPELAGRVRGFLGNIELQLERSIGEFLGLPDMAWERTDFEITRKAYRKDRTVGHRFEVCLTSLANTFLGWLHREKGMTYSRASLVNGELISFVLERLDGNLKDVDFLKQIPYKNHRSCQILVPDYQNLDAYLAGSFSMFNFKSYRGFAFIEGIPYWLEFLAQRGFLDEESHHLVFNTLYELFLETGRYWEQRGGEHEFDFPALQRAWTLEVSHQVGSQVPGF